MNFYFNLSLILFVESPDCVLNGNLLYCVYNVGVQWRGGV